MHIPRDEVLLKPIRQGISSRPSLTRLEEILCELPAALAVVTGQDHRVSYANDLFRTTFAPVEARDLIGLPVQELLQAISRPGLTESLGDVYRTGKSIRASDWKVPAAESNSGDQRDRFLDCTFQPIFDSAQQVESVLLLAVDVTDRMTAANELRESEMRLRLAQQAAQIGTWEWDPVENTRIMSPEMHRMYGTDPNASDDEILKVWSARVYGADLPHVKLQMAECQRTGVLNLEYRYEHPEMGLRHHHTRGRRMLGSSRFFGVVNDISDRKRFEQSLSQREEEFRSLADALPQLVWIGDAQWFNQRWYEFTGTTPEQNRGWAWTSVLDPEYLPIVERKWKQCLESGEPFEMVFSIRSRDGTYRPFLTRAVPVRNAAGTIIRWFGTNTDISGEFQNRREVEESQRKLQTTLDASQRLAAIVASSDDAIISKDLTGIVTSWNPCAERMFGYTAEEMIGSSIRKVIPPEVFEEEDRIMSAVGQGRRTEHFETVRQTKGGERLEISLTMSPVFDETGKILGVASISRDISQQKKVEKALHTSERLASVGRFAATIAHEINNPLEAVMNLTFLAQNCMVDQNGRTFLEQAQQELARVALLTKQTLGFYRENRGARQMTLGELVTPLISVFSARARNKQITIDTEIRQDPPVSVIPGEIRQLFANLFNNSIDAVGNRGRILIRLSAATERSGKCRKGARLTVFDNGPGIPPDVRKKLFEPFFTTKRDVGTGLGLWVTSNILLNHEGSIRVRSSVTPGDSWTMFSVFIPAGPATKALAS